MISKICFLLFLISIPSIGFSQSVDPAKLDSAILVADNLIETNPRIFFKNVESFIVYSDGEIRFEKYYHGTQKDSLHHIQSQTKSIVSLLLGIAIDKGFVPGVDEYVNKYFPEYFSAGESLKSKIKIKDLLTMSSGFSWAEMIPLDDPNNDVINMYNSNDYLRYALSKPAMNRSTGLFNYNSGHPMIIAGIIEKTAKMPLDKFAEEYLFKPLDISRYRWIKDSTGFCHAGGGLYLKPSDVLKIGMMVLNGGKWEERQIVSENWINRATQPYLATGFDISSYGYFWWIRDMVLGDGSTASVISAEGAGGQKLYIFPRYKLVIAFTERNYDTPQVSPIFIRESILPILK